MKGPTPSAPQLLVNILLSAIFIQDRSKIFLSLCNEIYVGFSKLQCCYLIRLLVIIFNIALVFKK